MSLTVIRPMQRYSSSTTISFSIRRWCSVRRASSCPVPSGTVARLSVVISSRIGCAGFSAKRTSRLVRMPTSLPPRSVTGMPLMRLALMIACASPRVASGWIVIGLTTIPLSNRLTARTAATCSSISRLRWSTPIPPSWAIAIAMSASVTVSIAEEMTGMLSAISRVSRVRVSAMLGSTSLAAGRSSTSSKVRARGISLKATGGGTFRKLVCDFEPRPMAGDSENRGRFKPLSCRRPLASQSAIRQWAQSNYQPPSSINPCFLMQWRS